MKLKLLKKIVATLMCTALVVGTMASCGNSDKESKGDYMDQTAQKGKLVVGLDDTFAPMGFRDEKGELVGFDIDLAKKVGEELKLEIEFKPISWDAKELELSSKNIDCIWNGMSVTPERKEKMALSNKYLDNTIILMKNKSGNIVVKEESDLKNVKIGTQSDSSALETMKKIKSYDEFKDNISEFPDYDKALLALKAGRIDVLAVDQVLGEYKNNKLNGELEVCEYKLGSDSYAIGFRKEDEALRDEVNKALKKLLDDKVAEEISQKWFGKNIVIYENL